MNCKGPPSTSTGLFLVPCGLRTYEQRMVYHSGLSDVFLHLLDVQACRRAQKWSSLLSSS